MKKQQNALQEMLFDIPWKADFAIAIALYIILSCIASIASHYSVIPFHATAVKTVFGMICTLIYGGTNVMKYFIPAVFIFLGIRGFLKK